MLATSARFKPAVELLADVKKNLADVQNLTGVYPTVELLADVKKLNFYTIYTFKKYITYLSFKKYYTYCLQLIFLYFCHYNKWHSACTI